MTRPKVSVIMLCYNQATYVAKALRSVLRQEGNFDLEIVLHDDASSDETPAICAEFSAKYPQIRLTLHDKNQGLIANTHAAYSCCTGDYIAICEGDDYWLSRHKLARQVAVMEQHPEVTLCFHRVINYYQQTGEWSLSRGGITQTTHLNNLAASNYITNLSVMYRHIIPQLPNTPTPTDYALHLLHAERGDIYYLPQVMGVYRKHNQGLWSQASAEGRFSRAYGIRLEMVQHFALRPDICQCLLPHLNSAAIELYRYYINQHEVMRATAIEEAMRTIMPTFDGQATLPPPARRSLLSRLRAGVTRCLPVPGKHI